MSFIIVLENLAPDNGRIYKYFGQEMRTESRIERIFRDAQLTVYDRSEATVLRRNYRPVRVWALH